LTLPREIALLWHGRLTIPRFLYFTSRYTLIIAWTDALVLTFGQFPMNFPHCTDLGRLSEAMEVVSQLSIAILLTWRTVVIYGAPFKILPILVPLILSIAVLGFRNVMMVSCAPTLIKTSAVALGGLLFSLACLTFDTTVVILTLYKYFRLKHQYDSIHVTLLAWVVQEGCFYYVLISMANLLNILIFWAAPIELIDMGNYAGRSLAAILTARFMLDLRADIEGQSTEASMIPMTALLGTEGSPEETGQAK